MHIKQSPKISIIIPCYNSEEFISRAINSVFNQTFTDWELILVNNNSTDNTAKILKEYQSNYPEKIKVVNEHKKGAPCARNRGLQEAKAEWIQFLDADDEILPDKLAYQHSLTKNSTSNLVASPYTITGVRNNKPFTDIRVLETGDMWLAITRSRLGITSANLFRRQALITIGGWNEKLAASQEYDLMFRLLENNPNVIFADKNLTNVHVTKNSVSRGGGKDKLVEILTCRIDLRKRIKNHLKANNALTAERVKYLDRFIFRQLIYNYEYVPEFVSKQVKTTELKVSLKERYNAYRFILKIVFKKALFSFIPSSIFNGQSKVHS